MASFRATAETTALYCLVHHWDEVAPFLHEDLFSDPHHRAAFHALAGEPTLMAALDATAGAARLVLEFVCVDEMGLDDPEGEALRLVDIAVRRDPRLAPQFDHALRRIKERNAAG